MTFKRIEACGYVSFHEEKHIDFLCIPNQAGAVKEPGFALCHSPQCVTDWIRSSRLPEDRRLRITNRDLHVVFEVSSCEPQDPMRTAVFFFFCTFH